MRAAIAFALALGPVTVTAGSIDISGQAPQEQCAHCHGMDGNSFTHRFPRLGAQPEDYLRKQLEDFRAQRRGDRNHPMHAATSDLDDDTLQIVAEHFSAQPAVGELEPDPDHLYHQGRTGLTACQECHGARGEGGNTFPRLAGQHPRYLERALRAFRDGERSNDPDGVMRDIAAGLSDEDIEALAAYLGSAGQ